MNERETAVYILMDIFEQQAYNNIALRRALKRNNAYSSVQKAFITEVVNGTLRNMILIDYVIDKFSKVKTKKMKLLILNILRSSVYQIMFMDKTPVSAVCNEAVKLTKQRGFNGLAGFVNGVLRNISRNINEIEYPDRDKNRIEYLSVLYSYPRWIIEYWLESYDYEIVEQMCIQNSLPPKVTICVNTIKSDSETVRKYLLNDGIEAEYGNAIENSFYISKTSDITNIKAYKEGLFHVMDESSMLAVSALEPKEGDFVLDVCGAPGGKSFYCAYLMNNKGRIVTRDIYEHKVEMIGNMAEHLGINIIENQIKDAMEYYEEDFKCADRVLIDAPCSGLGMVRKKPDIKYGKSFDDIMKLSEIQKNILSVCCKYVKDNGIFVYSTCTVSYEENEKNVEWFLKNHPFELIEQKQIFPQQYGGDGFFIAKMKRKAEVK